MNIQYTIIKSSRKTFSIRITEDNKIVVRAPLNASQRSIEKLIEKKRGWIEKVISFNSTNALNTPDIAEFRAAYVNGAVFPVIIGGKNYIDEAGVHVSNLKNFKAAYVKGEGADFLARFADTENKCALHAKTVNFRSYKGRWGCCDGENNIIFNFKLMMLPLELQYYVMVHELCHTIYHNHSRQFWQLVKKFVPDYSKLRSQLKNYNFLVKMY